LSARKTIALLCYLVPGTAATVTDHVKALAAAAEFDVVVLPLNQYDALSSLDLDRFDAVVIHYTIVAKNFARDYPEYWARLVSYGGLKAAFIQDEYRFVNETNAAFREFRLDVLFTCVPQAEIANVYGDAALPGVAKISVLTGYVPSGLAQLAVPPYERRRIDVGYRARKVPDWLGELGQEKWRIADRFARDASRYGLVTDISFREEDRLYEKKWIRFLSDCKAVLGTESGASVFDFSGDIQTKVDDHLAREPTTPFHLLQELYFKAKEGRVTLNQISPRCFEAAALRTLMVLYEGDYSGILKPWRHFVPLRKDHGNMDEVVAVLRDANQAQPIIEAAYRDVALNPAYSFSALTTAFEQAMQGGFRELEKRKSNSIRSRVGIDYDQASQAAWLTGLRRRTALRTALWTVGFHARRELRRAYSHLPSPLRARLSAMRQSVALGTRMRRTWQRMAPHLSDALAWFNGRYVPQLFAPIGVLDRIFPRRRAKSVVFINAAYYHFKLLARELRRRGWDAWSVSAASPDSLGAAFSHGEDANIYHPHPRVRQLKARSLVWEMKLRSAAVHFHGVQTMPLEFGINEKFSVVPALPVGLAELRHSGVRISYSVVGCNDGIAQSTWYAWSGGMCDKCRFQHQPGVCSDARNLAWGEKLAKHVDLVSAELMPRLDALAGANSVTVPLTYGVDEHEWRPDLEIPAALRLNRSPGEVIVMHAFGNFASRGTEGADPKGTKAIVAAVAGLRDEGLPVRLEFVHSLASRDMRFVQVQADIVVDQLYLGRYGAQARECMMLGRPVVGYLKYDPGAEDEETLTCLRECPIVNATPDTLCDVLRELVKDENRRREIGRRSREFALKWHSVRACADRFEREYANRLGIGRETSGRK
jgi:glycosyltransferase involved in cell wall biosynthesis